VVAAVVHRKCDGTTAYERVGCITLEDSSKPFTSPYPGLPQKVKNNHLSHNVTSKPLLPTTGVDFNSAYSTLPAFERKKGDQVNLDASQ